MDETKNQPKLSKDQLFEKLLDSIITKEEIETKGLQESIKNMNKPNNAIELVKKVDNLTKCNRNNISVWAYQQVNVFQKFKMSKKFISAVTEFGISKTTINFKIDIIKFIESYPKTNKSCISLYCLKNIFRVIKDVCLDNASEF